MDLKRAPWGKIFVIGLELIVAINIVLLNIWVLRLMNKNQQVSKQTITTTITSPTPTQIVTPSPTTPPQPVVVTPIPTIPSVKEYFIPFGSGTSTAGTWTDVFGLQAYINSAAYPLHSTVVFEASVYVPTGNQTVSVRLFDQTQQHPVWFSDVTMSGGQPVFLVSQPITLDPGNNLYQVQMQTQLQYSAQLTQSRVHITLK